jgi:lipopolysaccharide/colanic/teichoic acid biosynthesis glycosyltransferase
MGIVAILIRVSMGAPVLFRQQRTGLHGKPFTLLKLRTMTLDSDQQGRPLPDQFRLTPLGKFLRRTSIDELPQFWQVLKGDMSIVGPRPLPVEYLGFYGSEKFRRYDVRPGIVGWAGVNGRNANSWETKFEMDLWYVENWSLLLDLRIFFMAVGTVLSGAGVNEKGQATARPFTGSSNPGAGC